MSLQLNKTNFKTRQCVQAHMAPLPMVPAYE